jgi:hypothetical protein
MRTTWSVSSASSRVTCLPSSTCSTSTPAAYSLKDEPQRELFHADEERWMDQFGLTDEERALIRARDWIGLWRSGMSIYVMVKLSGVTKTPLPEIGKQMRESG